MQTLSNPSGKKSWQRIGQQLKAFFQVNPTPSTKGEEIDYYHQYVFPRRIERMKRIKNKSHQGISSKKL